ncbi:NifU family protein [Gluconobacter cerinus]|uniref:Iron transporter n=1 Tax=Gluconobacter cerinus TaxID=38307 RepID=A0A1B6VJY1_9PROT|nr:MULTISPECIES: NifU family protein [Gluconobacter]MBM3097281.1 NifU family protein [Gluconobacter cerinus]MBS0982483.1 NifU family protein [Gluconobacter cerinus]MBS1018494.1 NifU family protein [Gluconobacter cerinus]MBS1023840.1 NifU family protein [Gluconobacter cerinus]MBS1030470.1 NifU family protein [Gluconobacter cerinus]
MFIETEDTPNPATLKFLPGRPVTNDTRTVDFGEASAAEGRSELAEALFALPDVKRVFLGSDFVSITKAQDVSWGDLKPVVLSALTTFFESGKPVLAGDDEALKYDVAPEDADVVTRIRDLLDTRVRPAVAGDGGDIAFRGYRDGIVYLTMQGACSGCPSSRATLKHGVENMLRHYVPEVQSVEQVED